MLCLDGLGIILQPGLSNLVLPAASPLTQSQGSDSVVHISEEVQDASLVVPQVMWWSYILNVFLGIVALITMLFCIGPLEDAIASEIPYLALFLNTGSQALAEVLIVGLFIIIFSGNVTALATTSREVFAFARDKGFPFSHWLSRMEQKRHVPFNAVYITAVSPHPLSTPFCDSYSTFIASPSPWNQASRLFH